MGETLEQQTCLQMENTIGNQYPPIPHEGLINDQFPICRSAQDGASHILAGKEKEKALHPGDAGSHQKRQEKEKKKQKKHEVQNTRD